MPLFSRQFIMCFFFFFFSSRRRHTRFDCDWSSDVCSSDLRARARGPSPLGAGARGGRGLRLEARGRRDRGDAGGRERGGEGKRGDLGGRRFIKKKKKTR